MLPAVPPWLPVLSPVVALLAFGTAVWVAIDQRRSLRRLLGAVSDSELRRALLRVGTQWEPLTTRLDTLEAHVRQLRQTSATWLVAPGVVRFQAFDTASPALSFSVALLNAQRDGVILTALHARDQVRVYAKEVKDGRSAYPLSAEEARAMELALSPTSPRDTVTASHRGAPR